MTIDRESRAQKINQLKDLIHSKASLVFCKIVIIYLSTRYNPNTVMY